MNRTRQLAVAVLVTVGLFPVIVLGLNLLQAPDGYDAGYNAVSDLALGRGGASMAVAFCSLAAGTLLFAALLRQRSGRAPVRTGLLCLAGALSFVSAAFHTDLNGAPTTTHGDIHNAAGITTFVAMLVAMGTSSWRFRHEPSWRGFALPTAVLTSTGVIAFFLVPVLGQAHFGISQRLLIGSFLVWMLAAAGHQLRATGPEVSIPAPVPDAAKLRQ